MESPFFEKGMVLSDPADFIITDAWQEVTVERFNIGAVSCRHVRHPL